MPPAQGGLPTTAAGAEFGLVLAFVILRAFDLLQLALAAPTSVSNSPAPGLDLLLMLGFVTESVILCIVLLRRRRFDDARLVWVDVTAGSAVLVATWWFTQPADRFSTWAAWGYPVTLSVAVGAGIALRHWWETVTVVGLLAGLYLAVTLPGAMTSAETFTALTNALAYMMFAVVIRFPAGYMRRLAADADAARAEAARLAEEAERTRHRLLLHDHASVLSVLARPDADPELAGVARAQAAAGATRVRRFLSEAAEPAMPLPRQIEAVVAEFPDLDPTVNTDTAVGGVDPEAVDVIADALRTLLHNVRNHAHASEVVVYATTGPHAWEVQVSDNGCGFDPAEVTEGFGLSQQVRARIGEIGGTVQVTSAPGEGTSILLSGPMP